MYAAKENFLLRFSQPLKFFNASCESPERWHEKFPNQRGDPFRCRRPTSPWSKIERNRGRKMTAVQNSWRGWPQGMGLDMPRGPFSLTSFYPFVFTFCKSPPCTFLFLYSIYLPRFSHFFLNFPCQNSQLYLIFLFLFLTFFLSHSLPPTNSQQLFRILINLSFLTLFHLFPPARPQLVRM